MRLKKCKSVISFLNEHGCAVEFFILKEETRIECDVKRTWIKAALSVTKLENFAVGNVPTCFPRQMHPLIGGSTEESEMPEYETLMMGKEYGYNILL